MKLNIFVYVIAVIIGELYLFCLLLAFMAIRWATNTKFWFIQTTNLHFSVRQIVVWVCVCVSEIVPLDTRCFRFIQICTKIIYEETSKIYIRYNPWQKKN